jgi:hypothetical protein
MKNISLIIQKIKLFWIFTKLIFRTKWFFDYTFILEVLKESTKITRDNMIKYSNEYKPDLDIKIQLMNDSIESIESLINDDWLEKAETNLGETFVFDSEFKKVEDRDAYEMISLNSEIQEQINNDLVIESEKLRKNGLNKLSDFIKRIEQFWW